MVWPLFARQKGSKGGWRKKEGEKGLFLGKKVGARPLRLSFRPVFLRLSIGKEHIRRFHRRNKEV